MAELAAMMMNQQQQVMNMNRSVFNTSQMNPQVTKFNQNSNFSHVPLISKRIHSVDSRPQMVPMNRSYGIWPQQQFQNPNLSSDAVRPPPSAFNKAALGPRSNWKGKRVNKQIGGKRRMEQHHQQLMISSGGIGGGGGGNLNFRNYNPPTLDEMQHQNRLKTRKTFSKKFKNMYMNMAGYGDGGRAPRNTTSFLIRAKKSGGIAPVISPFPATPSVLATPILSPSTEVLGNMAKEEWGVDGYGSMKGLIRLRSQGNEDEEEEEGGGSSSSSSESDVEEHVEVERRLDHDLSRFEMIYDPNSGNNHQNVVENRVDDHDTHIAQLEEENLNLKERLFLMEGELGNLRRRLLLMEGQGGEENESEDGGESNGENDEEEEGSDGKLSRGDEGMKICGEVEAKENVGKLVVAATDACMLDSQVIKEETPGL